MAASNQVLVLNLGKATRAHRILLWTLRPARGAADEGSLAVAFWARALFCAHTLTAASASPEHGGGGWEGKR